MIEEGLRLAPFYARHLKGYSMGFAACYLAQCIQSKSEDVIDIQVYNQLVEVDSRLGISAAEQLFYCITKTLRLDVIKV